MRFGILTLVVVSIATALVVGPAASASLASEGGSVSASVDSSCALTSNGGVKCWGENDDADIGDGSNDPSSIPVDVSGLATGVVAVATGGDHTCALTVAGGVKCWGNNQEGELGTGFDSHHILQDSAVPVDVAGLTSGVAAIAASAGGTCALMNVGNVKCWGFDLQHTGNAVEPVDVTGLGSGVQAITVGGGDACAITSGGGVKCWGSDIFGQLGDGTTTDSATPVDVSGLTSGVTAISAGRFWTCAVTIAGGVKCWGLNNFGQLGDNTTTNSLAPVDVSGLSSGVADVSASDASHTCALSTSGGATCWGRNDHGQLGDNTTTNSSVPVDVAGLSNGVTAISAGGAHSCASLSGGGVQCWGGNPNDLGDGSTTDSSVPVDALMPVGADTVGPSIAFAVTGPNGGVPDGLQGWFVTSPVVGSVEADDTASGGSDVVSISCHPGLIIVGAPTGLGTGSASAPFSLSANDEESLSCRATDSAGNKGALSSSPRVLLDITAPSVTVSISDAPILLHSVATPTATATDEGGSGVAGSSCEPLDTSSVGQKTATCAANDVAGNSGTGSSHFIVTYNPHTPLPRGTFSAGATLPVEFRITDVADVPISDGLAQSIADRCGARISFNGNPVPLCPTYLPALNVFVGSFRTSPMIPPGRYRVDFRVFTRRGTMVMLGSNFVTIRRP